MRAGNPLLALHEALGAALMRDLADRAYQTTDWEAVAELRKTLTPAEMSEMRGKGQLPSKSAVCRPTVDQVDVQLFPQLWGSTALGYGGLGGAAMTTAYTVVVSTEAEACVYFGGGRLAYKVVMSALNDERRAAWQRVLNSREMPSVRQARELFGLE